MLGMVQKRWRSLPLLATTTAPPALAAGALTPAPHPRSGQIRDEVFLKGRYIEVGVHAAGSFGTE
jgi:hypothetical protein